METEARREEMSHKRAKNRQPLVKRHPDFYISKRVPSIHHSVLQHFLQFCRLFLTECLVLAEIQ